MPGVATVFDLDRAALADLLADEPDYRVDQVWHGLYRDHRPVTEITTLPVALREALDRERPEALSPVRASTGDGGETVKWLWRLVDGPLIETVLMHYDGRSTVCVSTQAGCAMGCGFCATGQAGFERHLTVGEVVEQIVRAARHAGDRRVSNVVFMGMGEPLANPDATLAAIDRLVDDLGLSARRITVSTVGVVPGIDRLTEHGRPVTLAVSLHAATDAKRRALLPVARRYPLDELADACHRWQAGRNRRLTLEWTMMDGVNDGPEDANELADLARSWRAHVNLIPLNPTAGGDADHSPLDRIVAFRDLLTADGVGATIRANRGTDIDAACGQLRARQVSAPGRSVDR